MFPKKMSSLAELLQAKKQGLKQVSTVVTNTDGKKVNAGNFDF